MAWWARKALGIRFQSVAPFNEPTSEWWTDKGTQEGCHFSTALQAKVCVAGVGGAALPHGSDLFAGAWRRSHIRSHSDIGSYILNERARTAQVETQASCFTPGELFHSHA